MEKLKLIAGLPALAALNVNAGVEVIWKRIKENLKEFQEGKINQTGGHRGKKINEK